MRNPEAVRPLSITCKASVLAVVNHEPSGIVAGSAADRPPARQVISSILATHPSPNPNHNNTFRRVPRPGAEGNDARKQTTTDAFIESPSPRHVKGVHHASVHQDF